MVGAHFLRNVSLFANLSIADLEPLSQRLVTRKFRSGERIFGQGSPGNSMYMVKTGLVAVEVTGSDGSSQRLAEFGPGQFFGEFSLLDGLPRSAGAVALERSELLILTRPDFFLYLEQHPAVAINLLVLLSRRVRFAMQRPLFDDDCVVPLVRLARILAQFAERYGRGENSVIQLSIRLTSGELAGMMGCPRSEAEAAINALQRKGLVEMRGLQVTIHDMDGLRMIAAERA